MELHKYLYLIIILKYCRLWVMLVSLHTWIIDKSSIRNLRISHSTFTFLNRKFEFRSLSYPRFIEGKACSQSLAFYPYPDPNTVYALIPYCVRFSDTLLFHRYLPSAYFPLQAFSLKFRVICHNAYYVSKEFYSSRFNKRQRGKKKTFKFCLSFLKEGYKNA